MNVIFIPESFNPKDHPNGMDIALLLHTILFKYVTDNRYYWGDGVSLRTDYLQNIIDRNKLKKVLTYCEDNGLIDIDKHYIVGAKCRKYSLGATIAEENTKRYMTTDPRALGRLDKMETNKRNKRTKNFNTIDKYIMNCVQNRVDYSRLVSLSPENLLYFASLRESKDKHKEKDPDHQVERLEILIDYVKHDEHNPSKDKNGRLYNTFTYLQRETRPLLLLDGEPIVFQDVSHTHPLCFLALATGKAQNLKIYTQTQHNTTQNTHTPLMNPCNREDGVRQEKRNMSVPSNRLSPELEKYKELVEQGELYRLVSSELNIELEIVKKQLLSFFYDKPREKCAYTDWFRDTFPHLLTLINDFKRADHRFLGNYLQQIEAEMMLNKVCYKLMIENPGIPLVTIHDCVGTTKKYKSIVYNKIKQEFGYIGLNPKIKEQ